MQDSKFKLFGRILSSISHRATLLLLLTLFTFCLSETFCSYGLCAAKQQDGYNIAVLDFFPIPGKIYSETIQDKNVFTGEVYNHQKYGKILIPNNYLDIIRRNFVVISKMQGKRLFLVGNPKRIPVDADLLVLGNVTAFHASKKQAAVSMNVQIVDVKDLSIRANFQVTQQTPTQAIRFAPNRPVHTVGEHSDDFHGLRTLLNYACYQSLQKIFTELEKVGP